MKKFIVGILSIFAFIHGLFGDVPSSLPIGSRQLLQAQALQNAAVANAGGWSSSTLGGNGNITYSTRKVANGIQGLEALKTMMFSFNIENPKDPVTLWSQLVDKDGNVLVNGRSTKNTVKSEPGVYGLVDNRVVMYYSDKLPIVFPEAQAAYVSIRNEKGETIREDSVKVQNGKILFPVALAGKSSLVVYTEDSTGGWVANLYKSDGSLSVKPDSVKSGIDPLIDNTVFVTDSHLNNVIVNSEGGKGNNPLFVLTLNKKTGVNFFATTSEGYFSTGYYVMKAGESTPKKWETPKGFEVVQELADGVYYIWFTWDQNEFQEYQQWYAPSQDNGGDYGLGHGQDPTY